MTRRVLLSVAFVAGLFFFLGLLGVLIGIALFFVQWLRPPRSFFWAAACALVLAAMLATLVQGLPSAPIVGPDFGARHWMAHALVAAALACAAWAGLLELAETRKGSSSPD